METKKGVSFDPALALTSIGAGAPKPTRKLSRAESAISEDDTTTVSGGESSRTASTSRRLGEGLLAPAEESKMRRLLAKSVITKDSAMVLRLVKDRSKQKKEFLFKVIKKFKLSISANQLQKRKYLVNPNIVFSVKEKEAVGDRERVTIFGEKVDAEPVINFAVRTSSPAVIRALLDHGANPSAPSQKLHRTSLHDACEYGNDYAVDHLIEAGCTLSARDWRGRTPLHIVVGVPSHTKKNICIPVLRALLLHATKEDLETPIFTKNTPTPSRILEYPLSSDEAWFDDKIKIAELEQEGNFVFETSFESQRPRPLHLCAWNGHIPGCKLLLEAGANMEGVDLEGDTPLFVALSRNHQKVVEYLIREGANLSHVCRRREPMLNLIARSSNTNVFRKFHESFETVDTKDIDGNTPLFWAAYNANLRIASILVQAKKADVRLSNKKGQTALHAVSMGSALPLARAGIVTLLLENGGDGAALYAEDKAGRTPLSQAAMNGFVKVVELLLFQIPGGLVSYNSKNISPMHFAAGEGKSAVVKMAIEKGIPQGWNPLDNDLMTPLLWAARGWHVSTCLLLLQFYPQWAFIPDRKGNTVLQYAAMMGSMELAQEVYTIISAYKYPPQGSYSFQRDYQETVYQAIAYCNTEIALFIIEKERAFAVEASDALRVAVEHSLVDVVKALLTKSNPDDPFCVDTPEYDEFGRPTTALHSGIRLGRSIVLNLSVSKNHRMDHVFATIQSSIGMSLDRIRISVGGTPLKRFKEASIPGYSHIGEFIKSLSYTDGSPQKMNFVLRSRGTDVLPRPSPITDYDKGLTLLTGQYCDMVDKGFLNRTDVNGDTPLHFAARRGLPRLLEKILRKKVEDRFDKKYVHIENSFKETALLAVGQNYCDCMCQNCNGFRVDAVGQAADELEGCCRCDCCNFCHREGAVHGEGVDGVFNKFLTFDGNHAYSEGHRRCIELLVIYGSNINVTNQWGSSPLLYAIRAGCSQSTKLFIEKGAVAFQVDKNGRSAFHEAARMGNAQVLKVLIQHLDIVLKSGDEENRQHVIDVFTGVDKLGMTPLMIAVLAKRHECTHLFLSHPLCNLAIDSERGSLLHLLIEMCAEHGEDEGYLYVLSVLSAHARGRSMRNGQGQSPYEMALQHGLHKCQSVLLESQTGDREVWITGLSGPGLHEADKIRVEEILEERVRVKQEEIEMNDAEQEKLQMDNVMFSVEEAGPITGRSTRSDRTSEFGTEEDDENWMFTLDDDFGFSKDDISAIVSKSRKKKAKVAKKTEGATLEEVEKEEDHREITEDPELVAIEEARDPVNLAFMLIDEELQDHVALGMMIEHNPHLDIKNSSGDTIFHLAVKYDAIDFLCVLVGAINDFKVPLDLVDEPDADGNTPFFIAVKNNRHEAVVALLDCPGVDMNKYFDHGRTALHYALAEGYVDLASNIMDYIHREKLRFDPCIKDQSGDTALLAAIRAGESAIVAKMLSVRIPHPPDLTHCGPDQFSVLHTALKCSPELVELILSMTLKWKLEIDVNSRNPESYTPLAMLVDKNLSQCIKYICRFEGIKVNVQNGPMMPGNALQYALKTWDDDSRCACALLDACLANSLFIDVRMLDPDGVVPIVRAIMNNQPEVLLKILKFNVNLDEALDEASILEVAIKTNEDPYCAVHLLEEAAKNRLSIDVELRNADGVTPLGLCVELNQPKIAAALMIHNPDAEASVNLETSLCPAQAAMLERKPEVAAAIFREAAKKRIAVLDPNRYDEEGYTYLHRAVEWDHVVVIDALAGFGPRLNINAPLQDSAKSLTTPLQMAIMACDPQKPREEWREAAAVAIMNASLRNRIPLNLGIKNRSGLKLIHMAAANNLDKLMEKLLDFNEIDVNAYTSDVRSALQIAVCAHENPVCALAMLQRCLERKHALHVNQVCIAPGFEKQSLIHYAVAKNYVEMVSLMLCFKIRIDGDTDDASPIHVALRCHPKDDRCAKTILRRALSLKLAVSSNLCDRDGYTPLHLAIKNNQVSVVELLLKLPNIEVNKQDEAITKNTPFLQALLRASSDQDCAIKMIEAERLENSRVHIGYNIENAQKVRPIHAIIENERADVLASILETRKVEVNCPHPVSGKPPLFMALTECNKPFCAATLLNRAINKGIDIDVSTFFDGMAPLHLAMKRKWKDVVTLLLRFRDTDPDAYSDEKGYSAMHFAVFSDFPDGISAMYKRDRGVTRGRFPWHDPPTPYQSSFGFRLPKKSTLEKVFFDKKCVDLNQYDFFGQSPLYYSIVQGKFDCMGRLLDFTRTIDIECVDEEGKSGLQVACSDVKGDNSVHIREFIEKASRRGLIVNVNKKTHTGEPPLNRAVRLEQISVINVLLNFQGIDISAYDALGRTALEVALRIREYRTVSIDRNREKAEQHIKQLANVEEFSHWFADAILEESLDIVNQEEVHESTFANLILTAVGKGKLSLDVNARDSEGLFPLTRAIRNGWTETVKILLENRTIIIQQPDRFRMTPLETAMHDEHGDESCAIAIIKLSIASPYLKIDINQLDEKGIPPILNAVYCRKPNTLRELLLYPNIDVNVKSNGGKTPIFEAVKMDGNELDDECARTILEEGRANVKLGLDVNTRDRHDNTLLHHVILCNKMALLHPLLEFPELDVNARNGEGLPPLEIMLLKPSSSVDVTKGNANFALAIDFLKLANQKKHNLDPNITLSNGSTTLIHSIHCRQLEVFKLLMNVRGIDINKQNSSGETALHVAICIPDPAEAVAFACAALEKGYADSHINLDYNMRMPSGDAPIHMATRLRYYSVITCLLRFGGIEVNTRDQDGYPLLFLPVFNSDQKALEMIMANDLLDLNLVDGSGYSVLHRCVLHKDGVQYEMIEEILRRGDHEDAYLRFNVNHPDPDGHPCLYYAIMNNDFRLVQTLLAYRSIDLQRQDVNDQTALSLAVQAQNVGDVRIVEAVLDKAIEGLPCNPNRANYDGWTPLQKYMANKENEEEETILRLCDKLLNLKVDLSVPDPDGRSALTIAILWYPDKSLAERIVRLMHEAKQIPLSINSMFHHAIKGNHLELAQALFDVGRLDKGTTEQWRQLVWMSCEFSDDPRMFCLVMKKLYSDYGTHLNMDFPACKGAHISLGRMAAMYAVLLNLPETLSICLKSFGANKRNNRVKDYSTGLSVDDANNGFIFLPPGQEPAELPVRTDVGLLQMAVDTEFEECAKILIIDGRELLKSDSTGDTALHVSATRKRLFSLTVMEHALKQGEDVLDSQLKKWNAKGYAAIHLAAKDANTITVIDMIEAGAEVDMLDRRGDTPLIHASKRGSYGTVKALLERGAAVNHQNHLERTALHVGVLNENQRIVDLLIDYGADPFIYDYKLEPPVFYATKEIKEYLRFKMFEDRLPMCVTIVYCSECEKHHDWHTRHTSKEYLDRAKLTEERIREEFPYIDVILQPLIEADLLRLPPDTRFGAFELYWDDNQGGHRCLFKASAKTSKFVSLKNLPDILVRALVAIHHGGELVSKAAEDMLSDEEREEQERKLKKDFFNPNKKAVEPPPTGKRSCKCAELGCKKPTVADILGKNKEKNIDYSYNYGVEDSTLSGEYLPDNLVNPSHADADDLPPVVGPGGRPVSVQGSKESVGHLEDMSLSTIGAEPPDLRPSSRQGSPQGRVRAHNARIFDPTVLSKEFSVQEPKRVLSPPQRLPAFHKKTDILDGIRDSGSMLALLETIMSKGTEKAFKQADKMRKKNAERQSSMDATQEVERPSELEGGVRESRKSGNEMIVQPPRSVRKEMKGIYQLSAKSATYQAVPSAMRNLVTERGGLTWINKKITDKGALGVIPMESDRRERLKSASSSRSGARSAKSTRSSRSSRSGIGRETSTAWGENSQPNVKQAASAFPYNVPNAKSAMRQHNTVE